MWQIMHSFNQRSVKEPWIIGSVVRFIADEETLRVSTIRKFVNPDSGIHGVVDVVVGVNVQGVGYSLKSLPSETPFVGGFFGDGEFQCTTDDATVGNFVKDFQSVFTTMD